MSNEPENIECSSCGASLRPGASFCHKCGAKFFVVDAETASPKGEDPAVSSAWFKADISAPEENSDEKPPAPEFLETIPDTPFPANEPEDIPAPAISAEAEDEVQVVAVQHAVRAKPARKPVRSLSDPDLRRKPKLQREKIEMMWEEPEGGINTVFVVGSVVIFVLVLLMILAVYFVR
jgi:uncharacterized Zn finger protein (UPF0148 family)